jgi:hypothetical protein
VPETQNGRRKAMSRHSEEVKEMVEKWEKVWDALKDLDDKVSYVPDSVYDDLNEMWVAQCTEYIELHREVKATMNIWDVDGEIAGLAQALEESRG